MKKILLTATMLVGFAAVSQAQQGRVGINTTTPAATLDVVGTPTDATRPDALLVPRMTRAQLQAKDAVYAAAQNGALAFVSSIADGSATGKAVNVTAVGFYYYDGITTNTWIAVGGNSAPATTSVKSLTSSYTVLPTDDVLLFTTTAAATLTLPATGIPIGKRIYVSVGGASTADVTFSPTPREGATPGIFAGYSATLMYTGDATNPWSVVSGY